MTIPAFRRVHLLGLICVVLGSLTNNRYNKSEAANPPSSISEPSSATAGANNPTDDLKQLRTAMSEFIDTAMAISQLDLSAAEKQAFEQVLHECDVSFKQSFTEAQNRELKSIMSEIELPDSSPAPLKIDARILEKGNETMARLHITRFELALQAFEVDCGRYPTEEEGLQALVVQPQGADGWKRGGYMKTIPLDPWNHPYVYHFPGKHNAGGPDISSNGPLNQEGSINNWDTATHINEPASNAPQPSSLDNATAQKATLVYQQTRNDIMQVLTPEHRGELTPERIKASAAVVRGRATEVGHRVKCASNLRQIGQAILLYAQEHRQNYPQDFGSLYLSEEIEVDAFLCPSAATSPPIELRSKSRAEQAAWINSHSDYIYLAAGKVAPPGANVPVACDEKKNHAGIPGASPIFEVLYGDGHVEAIQATDATTLRSQIDAIKHR